MKRLFTSAAFLLLTLSSLAPIAAAEPTPPAGDAKKAGTEEPEWKMKQRRQALFDEGQRLLEQGRPREALVKFREVHSLRSHPRVLLWMALAEERLGHVLKARAIYEQAKVDAREAKLDDVEQDATKALSEIAPKIPRILVLVSSETWFTVQVDSATVSLNNGRVEVEPGRHTVVVRAPDKESYSTEINLRAGEVKIINASLSPTEPPSGRLWGGCAGCAVGSNSTDSPSAGVALLVLSLVRRAWRRRKPPSDGAALER